MKFFDKKFDRDIENQEKKVQQQLETKQGKKLVAEFGLQKAKGAYRQQHYGTHKGDFIPSRRFR